MLVRYKNLLMDLYKDLWDLFGLVLDDCVIVYCYFKNDCDDIGVCLVRDGFVC